VSVIKGFSNIWIETDEPTAFRISTSFEGVAGRAGETVAQYPAHTLQRRFRTTERRRNDFR
jgi:hypothetical protein